MAATEQPKVDASALTDTGSLPDGASVVLSQGGQATFRVPNAVVQNEPGVGLSPSTKGALYVTDNVVSRKPPKAFKAEGRLVDMVDLLEVEGPECCAALGWAVQSYIPAGNDGHFFKAVLLKLLTALSGPEGPLGSEPESEIGGTTQFGDETDKKKKKGK